MKYFKFWFTTLLKWSRWISDYTLVTFHAFLNFPYKFAVHRECSHEKFLNACLKNTRHVCRPHHPIRHTIKQRRNCILCRALLCITVVPGARIKRERVFKSARNDARLSLYVIICGDVQQTWTTGAVDSSGFWFRILRAVSYLFFEAWSDDR